MKYLENQTNFIAPPYKPCDGGLEYLAMMAAVQFVSFFINLVATVAVWKVPGKENNKFHLAVRTLVLSDLSISASTLPFSLVSHVCELFLDQRRNSLLHHSVYLKHILKLVVLSCFHNLFVTLSRSNTSTLLQKPSDMCTGQKSFTLCSDMALCSFDSASYWIRQISAIQERILLFLGPDTNGTQTKSPGLCNRGRREFNYSCDVVFLWKDSVLFSPKAQSQ